MTTIGIIGSGNIGSNVARAAVAKGYDVVISNSRGPDSLQELVSELGKHARAGTTEEAVAAGDMVLIAIPLISVTDLPVEPFEDKIILDANNYYPERDGRIEALDKNETTTSEIVQSHFPYSHVVKTFNSIPAKHIPEMDCLQGIPTVARYRLQATPPERRTKSLTSSTTWATTCST